MTYPEHIRQQAADRANAFRRQISWTADDMEKTSPGEALCQCIEELDAAIAERDELVAGVREARKLARSMSVAALLDVIDALLAKYEKPDPLVEAMATACVRHGFHTHDTPASLTKHLRAELKERGLAIKEIGA